MKLILVLLLPLFQAVAQLPDPDEIMTKSRDLTLIGSSKADLTLTITEKNGSTRTRKISMTTMSFPDGLEKRMIKFIEPAEVKGTALLIIDNKSSADEMWIYLPALKKTRRIVSSEKGKSFMSSEFSNSDMTSPPLTDFTDKHMAGSGSDGEWIIESKPLNEDIADEYGFSKKVTYLSMTNDQLKRIEFYDFDNKIFKVMKINSIYPLNDGKYMIREMVADNLSNSRKSEIVFNNISEGIKVDDSFFSVRNLER
jgi:hypothetical protein